MTWKEVIDQLTLWRADPSVLDYDEITPPTPPIFDQAIRYALKMRNAPPPLTVTPDPNGGIVFAWASCDYRIRDDGDEIGHEW